MCSFLNFAHSMHKNSTTRKFRKHKKKLGFLPKGVVDFVQTASQTRRVWVAVLYRYNGSVDDHSKEEVNIF